MEEYREGNLLYRVAGADEVDDVIMLIEDIYSRISDKDTFIRDTEDDIKHIFSSHNFGLVVYLNDKLVAYRYMSYAQKVDSLAKYVRYLEIPEHDIVNMESVMVHEDARGLGIQNKSRSLLIEYMIEHGFNIFMSTVSPDNEYSFKNVLQSGFTLVELADVYKDEERPEGWKRFIFYRNYKDELKFTDEEIRLHPNDYDGIDKALSNQFFGVDFIDGFIVFKKLYK